MADIDTYAPQTGRMLKEDGTTENIADILGSTDTLIDSGSVAWTTNEDSAEELDFDVPSANKSDTYEIYIRNGSHEVDLSVDIGNRIKLYPDATSPAVATACVMDDSDNNVVAAAHGLSIGDVIRFSATTGGVTVTTDYFVIGGAGFLAGSFQFSTTRGGSAFDVTADGANSFAIVEEFFVLAPSNSVPKFAAATTTASRTGVKSFLVSGFLQGEGGRLRFHKSAVNAAAFEAAVQIRRV